MSEKEIAIQIMDRFDKKFDKWEAHQQDMKTFIYGGGLNNMIQQAINTHLTAQKQEREELISVLKSYESVFNEVSTSVKLQNSELKHLIKTANKHADKIEANSEKINNVNTKFNRIVIAGATLNTVFIFLITFFKDKITFK